jgi:hypothetical protein
MMGTMVLIIPVDPRGTHAARRVVTMEGYSCRLPPRRCDDEHWPLDGLAGRLPLGSRSRMPSFYNQWRSSDGSVRTKNFFSSAIPRSKLPKMSDHSAAQDRKTDLAWLME